MYKLILGKVLMVGIFVVVLSVCIIIVFLSIFLNWNKLFVEKWSGGVYLVFNCNLDVVWSF